MSANISVDLTSREAIYLQIANQIRRAIHRGDVKPGEQLPTVRQLSAALGINLNTAAQAYRELAAEGLLDLRRGSGVRVLPPPNATATEADRQTTKDRLEEIALDGLHRGLSVSQIQELWAQIMEELSCRTNQNPYR